LGYFHWSRQRLALVKPSIYTLDFTRPLDKLLIEQTKSRAHRSGDNGLVESKNGAIVRKHMGFGHMGAQHAEAAAGFIAGISIRM
jgi:hypothetical protein